VLRGKGLGRIGCTLVDQRQCGELLATGRSPVEGAAARCSIQQAVGWLAPRRTCGLHGQRRQEGDPDGADDGQGGDAPQQVRQ
jgi:hypothetical protein